MDIEKFASVVGRQYQWLTELSELDGHFLDVPKCQWQRATGADHRRVDEWLSRDSDVLPSADPPGYRSPPTRVLTALSIFNFRHHVVSASQMALAECEKHNELAGVAGIVLQLTTDHLEWLSWLKTGRSEQPDPESQMRVSYQDLTRALNAHGLLSGGYEKAEWDRWLSLCSTAKRRDLLSLFWLAKKPMKRSEIAPGSGNEFRQVVKELNELAAKASPLIPWMIRSDSQQKWAKHWFGKQR